ncbi:23S rRNA pseudouridine 2633 (=2605 standard) pseudouridine synthase [Petrocella atlantisensis]|uniref:Pseudouridine synthase n=1 Tax=Petrocella atlantisensis TaxID=2173034 RepID=A0A3P7P743_9FIRM|nr:pseudouridine synthase [Petrocella atlantisensis]MCF8018765.1 rRNA pseudouridine synthase [Vallitaleaceae bacterium]VDN46133.1 23S rRNA pseudouridine 2633 (=2605 standard) pseudouridine synthase [Petrocella atlantisensis]
MEIRLQKYIADAGIASRRAAEKLISNGEIKVNGQVVREMGVKINPVEDVVTYKNKDLKKVENLEYYLLHKPVRVVSTASDEKNRTNVVDMVKSHHRLYPVGRLDYMSSGLIILTNDGDLTYKLTHPKHDIEKHYEVKIEPPITESDVKKLRVGVNLDGEKTRPCKVKLIKDSSRYQVYSIILQEGKNRQIRRMVEVVGSSVVALERTAIGSITMAGLKYGQYRPLTRDEIDYLKQL